jgi:hypothetical protein
MTVIDLDGSPAAPEPRRPPSRPRLVLGALALIVTGAAVGGVAVSRRQQQRTDDERRSAVSLVILPDMLQRPDDGVTPTVIEQEHTSAVVLTGHVNVVNAGPAPVRLAGFGADRIGLRLTGEPWLAPNPLIPAGGSTVATIHATVPCDADPLTEPVAVTVDLVTADGQRRQPTAFIDGRAWAESIEKACAQQWTRSLGGRGR